MLQGLILSLVHLNDEAYQFVLYREFKSWFGEPHREDQDKRRKSTAFELMTAQLSVDLIYTILYSITEHTVGIKKSAEFKSY